MMTKKKKLPILVVTVSFRVCRPQKIMVCVGKRCKANCTFSAEKYTWFTVWKSTPPPPTISCVHLQQSKTKHKIAVFFTTSHIWQFKNTSAQCVSTISEHFRRHWDVFTCCCSPAHHEKQVWRRQLRWQGPFSSVIRCETGNTEFPGNDIQSDAVPTCHQSTGAKRAATARPAFIVHIRGLGAFTQCLCPSGVWPNLSLYRKFTSSQRFPFPVSFFLCFCGFFCSYVLDAPLFKTGSPQR